MSNPYGVGINVVDLTHARLRQAWAMYSNRCRGMSLIEEYRFLIAKTMVFEANQEIGVPGGVIFRAVGAFLMMKRAFSPVEDEGFECSWAFSRCWDEMGRWPSVRMSALRTLATVLVSGAGWKPAVLFKVVRFADFGGCLVMFMYGDYLDGVGL
jgi:hypothetical protein